MKILVTGGAGFIGSHLADAFLAQGHEVSILDNLSTGRRENIPQKSIFYEKDICDSKIVELIQDIAPDAISHQAAQIDVRKSVNDPRLDAQINILGSLNVLEAARQAKVKKIMFASTGGAIYGEQDYFPADETHPLRPCSPYGIAKLSVEKYLDYYSSTYGISVTTLRYANVYGPRQNPHGEAGVVAIFCEKMLKNQQPVINGNGLQTRDYVFVQDVVQANLLTLNTLENQTYNVGTGIETNVNEIFQHLVRISGLNYEECHGPAKVGEQMRSVLSHQKLTQKTGWLPQQSLFQGLERTFQSYLQ